MVRMDRRWVWLKQGAVVVTTALASASVVTMVSAHGGRHVQDP
jgi:hypothetical protein